MSRSSALLLAVNALECKVDRAIFRAAIVAQRQGRLDTAGLTIGYRTRKRRHLWLPATLFALDSTELRLGGAIAFACPSRSLTNALSPWLIDCLVYPEREAAELRLEPPRTSRRKGAGITAPRGEPTPGLAEAVRALMSELETCVGAPVSALWSM